MLTVVAGSGSANGPEKTGFAGWFRYPAGFSDHAFSVAYSHMQPVAGSTIVDPFAGVASGGVRLSTNNLRFRGLEAHPLVAELANLKFSRPGSGRDLLDSARRL